MLYSNWPVEALQDEKLTLRMYSEIESGKNAAAILNSPAFYIASHDLDSGTALALVIRLSGNAEAFNACRGQGLRALVTKACLADPAVALGLLEVKSDNKDDILRAIAAAGAELPSGTYVLSDKEKAIFTTERLVNSINMNSETVSNSLEAVTRLTQEDAMEFEKPLLRFFLEECNQPKAAFSAISNLPLGSVRNRLLEKLVADWASVDVIGASETLAAQPQNSVTDTAIAGLVKEIRGDPEAVVAWANRMASRDTGRAIALQAVAQAPPPQREAITRIVDQLWPQ